jgi:hypothetical protein
MALSDGQSYPLKPRQVYRMRWWVRLLAVCFLVFCGLGASGLLGVAYVAGSTTVCRTSMGRVG